MEYQDLPNKPSAAPRSRSRVNDFLVKSVLDGHMPLALFGTAAPGLAAGVAYGSICYFFVSPIMASLSGAFMVALVAGESCYNLMAADQAEAQQALTDQHIKTPRQAQALNKMFGEAVARIQCPREELEEGVRGVPQFGGALFVEQQKASVANHRGVADGIIALIDQDVDLPQRTAVLTERLNKALGLKPAA